MRTASRVLAILASLFFGWVTLMGAVSAYRSMAAGDFQGIADVRWAVTPLWGLGIFGLSLILLHSLRPAGIGNRNGRALLSHSLGTMLFGLIGVTLLLSIFDVPARSGDEWKLLLRYSEGRYYLAASLLICLAVLCLSVWAIRQANHPPETSRGSQSGSLGFRLFLFLVLVPILLSVAYYVSVDFTGVLSGAGSSTVELHSAAAEVEMDMLHITTGFVFLLLAFRSLSRLRSGPERALGTDAGDGDGTPVLSP